MKNLKTVLAAGLLVTSSAVNAATITFNEFAFDATRNDESHLLNPFSSLGFFFETRLVNHPSGLQVWGRDSTYQADPGYAAIFVGYGGYATTMTSSTRSPFNFYSIDLADLHNAGLPITVRLDFEYSDGVPWSKSFTLDNESGLQTFALNQRGVQSVSWKTIPGDSGWVPGDSGWYQFDNVVATAVSESEIYAMLIAGLGLFGAIARRKRRAIAA